MLETHPDCKELSSIVVNFRNARSMKKSLDEDKVTIDSFVSEFKMDAWARNERLKNSLEKDIDALTVLIKNLCKTESRGAPENSKVYQSLLKITKSSKKISM